MKTVAPFCDLEELPNLLETELDEFYVGVLEDKWIEKYSESFSANKRAKKKKSLNNFEDLESAYKLINSKNKKLHFIFNNFYVESQKEDVEELFEKAKNIGIKYFTVTDFHMLKKVKDAGLNPTLSITSPVLNQESAKFFKELGAKKIILPRDLNLKELEAITTNVKDVEYEVIIFNDSCPNIDGLCRFFHGQNKDKGFVQNACIIDYDLKISTNLSGNDRLEISRRVSENNKLAKYTNSCGVCYLRKLDEIGIEYLKIPSRGHPIQAKRRDIKFIHSGIKRINDEKVKTKEEYADITKNEYTQIFGNSCAENCYFK